MRITKRSTRIASLAIGLALIAAACGSDNKKPAAIGTAAPGSTAASSETTAAPETTAAAAPSGGTVTYAAEQEYTSYNNGSADQVLFANTLVLNMVQPGPFISEPDLSFKLWDDMMVSADVTSKDPQVVQYVVKPEAVWSDGEQMGCDDFRMAWYANNGKVTKPNPDFTGPGQKDADGKPVPETLPVFNTASTTGYKDISKLDCSADGKTITTTYDKVFADWQSLFGALLPAHIVMAGANVTDLAAVDSATLSPELEAMGDFWNTKFVGFDPAVDISGSWFSIDSFTPGQNLILKRNEKFFGKPANLDSIVFLQVPDATQEPAALENGDVQVISPQPNPDLVKQVQDITGVTSEVDQGVTFEHFDFNQANKHLADVNVRKAISLCIDRDEIVSTLVAPLNPEATVLNNRMYIPSSPDYKDNSKGLKRDIPAAKALLESSGYVLGADGIYAKGGDRLSLRLGRRDPNPRRQSTNELAAEQCKEAGIEFTDDPSEDFNAVRLSASDYDVALFAWVATAAQSSNTAIYVPPADGGDQNWNNYSNAALSDLFAQANAELDATKRADLMNQIDSVIWDDMATLPLFQFQEMIAFSDTVENVVYNGPLGVTWNANEWSIKA